MGFNSFNNSTRNPATKYYKWSGGAKEEVALPDGTTATKVVGRLTYWDSDAINKDGEQGDNIAVPLPFRFCILEQSRSITGFSPTPGTNIRYYSNETVQNDEVLVVQRKDDSGNHEVCRGTYDQIKASLPQGARLQINLYIFNPDTMQIERLNLQGSSVAAFIDFSKKNKEALYTRVTTMESAGELKKNGSVEYMPPVFKSATVNYSDEEMKELTKQDQIVVEYLKYRSEQNRLANGESAENTQSEYVGSIDQTPTQYQGDENQETGGAGDEINLEEIPF